MSAAGMRDFSFLVKYGPDSGDCELVTFSERDDSHAEAGAEAMLRDYLATRHHTYGNTDFEVWPLTAPMVKYDAKIDVRVRRTVQPYSPPQAATS